MDQSILDSIKKLLGIDPEYDVFDTDVIMHINSVFSQLFQLGASPVTPFRIEDNTATWGDFLGDLLGLDMVKSYVYFKVRSYFDPPSTSFGLTALEKQISELEWRLSITEIKFNPDAYTIPDPVPAEDLELI